MSLDQPIAWAAGHLWPVALLAGVLVAICGLIVRRTSGAVLAAGIGALICTAYSADTSWRFAEHRLGMADVDERAVMFAAGEGALLACAIMARANKRATATDTAAGTPGVAGVLVWGITGIQIIPAFSESGFWGGTVRAVIGPVMASMLWHLAMGLEIRVSRPEALSSGLPAQIGHELRERLLSRLGLAVRGRSAEQLSRDRATQRAVRLASRKHLGPWGRAALKASVARSGAAIDGDQRHQLLQLLAARRNAAELRTVPVTSPWVEQPLPEPYPSTPLGVTGAELRRMDPVDAVLRVHAAHPEASPAELASLCTEYGVPVSEAQVRVALHAVPDRRTSPTPAALEQPAPLLFASPEPRQLDGPTRQDSPTEHAPADHSYSGTGLQLYLATEPQVRPEVACAVPAETIRRRPTRTEVHARVPDPPSGIEDTAAADDGTLTYPADEEPATPTQVADVPAPLPVPEAVPADLGAAGTGDWERLLAQAREVDAAHRRTHGRPAPIKTLKRELRVGQARAQLVRDALAEEAKR
ncbi:hypothetical protein [Streptomyces sp. NBC_00557]|uniref:hypothetical protein n=1 Tax=Streptomyces sp. NBC_00557 TaxID=2975776 RepID=UPI002E810C82|nr:hypothetical protein [Streptomyces sp. NBC_00557]WUC36373.1 hypothetical protein OG956_20190 [Streptomyces sp. NBC_00557]